MSTSRASPCYVSNKGQCMKSKVILVTGASSGIGEATVMRLKAAGHTIYAAARRVEKMQKLAEAGIRVLPLDVTESVSIQKVVDTIIAECGRIDVVVNNAGYGSYGAVEEVSLEEGRAQFEVNVFGAVQLTQRVLPHMRAQRFGTVINITSMGGRFIHLSVPGITEPNLHWKRSATACVWKWSLSVLMSWSLNPVALKPSGQILPPRNYWVYQGTEPMQNRHRRWPIPW